MALPVTPPRVTLLACMAALWLAVQPALAIDSEGGISSGARLSSADAGGGAVTDTARDTGDAAYFAQNASQPGVVALPGGGQARRLAEGTGATAAGAQMVVVNLARRGLHEAAPAAAPDGTPPGVQNARYRTQNLPRPLFEAVQLMKVGDRWEVFVPAYTPKTRGASRADAKAIPASIFTIELVSAH